jgi:hypothetical protein
MRVGSLSCAQCSQSLLMKCASSRCHYRVKITLFRVCVEDWGCFQLVEAAGLRIMDLSRLQTEFAVLCPK